MKRRVALNFRICGISFLLAVPLGGCLPIPRGGSAGSVVVTYSDLRGGDAAEPSYETRFTVSVDGSPPAESPAAGRYERKALKIDLMPGTRRLVVEGWALRNGTWEKRTKENGYLFDHRLEKSLDIKAGESATVNFCVPDRRENLTIRL